MKSDKYIPSLDEKLVRKKTKQRKLQEEKLNPARKNKKYYEMGIFNPDQFV